MPRRTKLGRMIARFNQYDGMRFGEGFYNWRKPELSKGELYECAECLAVVTDLAKHAEWHCRG